MDGSEAGQAGRAREDTGPDPWVISLERVGAGDVASVGGKGANLGVLIRSALPVPDGFVVTTAAFQVFFESCAPARLLSPLAALDPADLEALSDAGQRLRSHLLSQPIPPEVERAIRARLERFAPDHAWAVRSSATAEDLADASFAGQQDTFLNVRSQDDLLDRVRACWASLFSDRAIAYRIRNRIDHARVRMAVVVQTLVPAEAAGVLFTADPVSGRADRLVLEATFGLGEALVSGRVAPDRFVLGRSDLEILERAVAQKGLELVRAPRGGVVELELPLERAATPCIDDHIVRRLGALALRAEAVFGGPQDLEWAVAGGQVYLLQSRPITTLRPPAQPPPAAAVVPSGEDGQVWTNMNAGEVLPDVVTPFTWSLLELILLDPVRRLLGWLGIDPGRYPLWGEIAGRIYFNLNTTLGMLRAMPFLKRIDPNLLFGGVQASLLASGGLEVLERNIPPVRLHPLTALMRFPYFVLWLLTRSRRRAEQHRARFVRMLDEAQARDLETLSERELGRELARLLEQLSAATPKLLGYAVVGAGNFSNLDRLLRTWLPDGKDGANLLITGIGGMASAEAGLELWRLAVAAHEAPAVEQAILAAGDFSSVRARLETLAAGHAFLARWDAFMRLHGHHARGEIELGNPRWSETPDYLLELIRGYLENVTRIDPLATHAAQAVERERRARDIRQRLGNPLKILIFDLLMRGAQRGVVYRENMKSDAVRFTALLRRLALEAGRRLVARGLLTTADDVFFLDIGELGQLLREQAASAPAEVVSRRRAVYERHRAITPPSVVIGRFDPELCVPDAVDTRLQVLKGLAVSPGVVTGRARVILRSDTGERVLAGEVLVAPFTDPGWTPYFLPAAAIVMDMGGLLSHGSIVAREYGIPAVVNVGPATRLLRTGQLLEVDGTRGEVRVLEG